MTRLPARDFGLGVRAMTRTGSPTGRGWLRALRRYSGVGVVLFALIFVVGSYRAHALALVVGDDDLCSAMSYAAGRSADLTNDPADLADRHHACCDLGLCLDASALAPEVPAALSAPHVTRARPRRRLYREPQPALRRGAHRPRGPPIH